MLFLAFPCTPKLCVDYFYMHDSQCCGILHNIPVVYISKITQASSRWVNNWQMESRACMGAAPGKPQMKVVRKTRSGIRRRSLCSRSRVWPWGGRFMESRVRLDMCCSGMSMYLHTCCSTAGRRLCFKTCSKVALLPVQHAALLQNDRREQVEATTIWHPQAVHIRA